MKLFLILSAVLISQLAFGQKVFPESTHTATLQTSKDTSAHVIYKVDSTTAFYMDYDSRMADLKKEVDARVNAAQIANRSAVDIFYRQKGINPSKVKNIVYKGNNEVDVTFKKP